MRRVYAVGLVVSMVAANAAAFFYLRDRMVNAEHDPTGYEQPSAQPSQGAETLDDEDLLMGKVTLAGASDGSLLRLTTGSCSADGESTEGQPLGAWTAEPGGQPSRVTIPGLAQTLAAGSDDDGWWIVGADAQCGVHGWRSDGYAGTTWDQGEVPENTWYVDPKRLDLIHTTRIDLTLPSGCQATEVHTVGTDAAVVCKDRRGLLITRADRAVSELRPSGLVAVALRPDGREAALYDDVECVAGARLLVGERDLEPPHCFGNDKAPLGIAWAGGEPVAQVGFSLFDHDGEQWVERSS